MTVNNNMDNSTDNAINSLKKMYFEMLESGFGREVSYEDEIRKDFLESLIQKLDPLNALAEFQEKQNEM